MNICRRTFLKSSAGGVAALTLPGSRALAQTYPTRPVTIIASLAAGTGLDTVTRRFGEQLNQSLGQPMVVENRAGGAGLAAIQGILKAPADGHTLAVVTSGGMAIRPTILKNVPYDPVKDLIPLSLYLKSPFVLVINPSLPPRDALDLIDYIKQRPGKMSFSSPSVGSVPHLAGEYLKQQFDLEMTHVPYRATPQLISDVVAGHVPITFAEAGASIQLIKDGKLRALAVTSTTRLREFPDVPSFAEASGIKDWEAVGWHVLVARAGTPQAIAERLQAEMNRIMTDARMQEAITKIGLIPLDPPLTGEAARSYIRSESEKWGDLVRKLGLAGAEQ